MYRAFCGWARCPYCGRDVTVYRTDDDVSGDCACGAYVVWTFVPTPLGAHIAQAWARAEEESL
jgi:hypothetical protein